MSRTLVDSGIEWMGKIPSDWEISKLKNLYKFEKGKNAAIYTKEYIAGTTGIYPVYSGQTENNGIMGNIDTYDYDISECLFTTTVGANVMTVKVLNGKFSLSQNCLIMLPKNNNNNHYYYYLLCALFDYEKSLVPSYMQPSLRIEDLKKYSFYVPPVEEQKRIADYLDSKCSKIDQVIEDNNKAIELLEEYKNNYLSDVFKELGKDNKYIKLKYLGSLQNGISAAKEKFESGNGVFINYGDVYNYNTIPANPSGIIDLTESESNIYSLRRGDILFTRTSETIEEVGMSAVCIKDYPNSAFSGFVIRFRPYVDNMVPEFYKYFFNLSCHRDYFAREMNLVTRASLSQGLLGNINVLLPSIDEQKQIANKLDSFCIKIDKVIEYRKKIIEKLEEYKKSLIYEVVTGKKEV